MDGKIRIVILEDHQAVVDGYALRLNGETDVQIVGTLFYGEDLEETLTKHQPVHVLILDVQVPTSADNRSPYPILQIIPKLVERYPGLNILVVSMYKQAALIKAVMDAGASGFVLKDDRDTIENFASVMRTVAGGGVYFSKEAYEQYRRKVTDEPQLSVRQMEVLSLAAAYPDYTSKEMGKKLGLANATVRNVLSSIYLRFDVGSRTAAVDKAKALGLLASVEVYPMEKDL